MLQGAFNRHVIQGIIVMHRISRLEETLCRRRKKIPRTYILRRKEKKIQDIETISQKKVNMQKIRKRSWKFKGW